MSTNRIITRGMGPSRGAAGRAGMITLGYAGIPEFVIIALSTTSQLDRRRLVGGTRPKSQIDFVIAWAKLVSVNDEKPNVNIVGSVKVPIMQRALTVFTEHVSSRARSALEFIKVKITRVR